MNDSANSTPLGKPEAIVELATVCDHELAAIALRRDRKFDRKEDKSVIRQSLIGLALSGCLLYTSPSPRD